MIFYIEKNFLIEYNIKQRWFTVAYNLLVVILKKMLYAVIPVLISFSVFIGSFINNSYVKTAKTTVADSNLPVIIIDAGHGGFDGGAVAFDGTLEKDINLKISLYLRDFLNLFGLKTVMIREADESVESEGLSSIREKKSSDLHNRMKIMDNTDNALYISIHQNKYSIEKYSGTQVFYSPKTREESALLAQSIQDSIVNTLQNNNTRQIKECGTSVFLMYNAVKPAVLVECGFLSNHKETELLKTTEYQKKIAFCIAMGINDYITSRNE